MQVALVLASVLVASVGGISFGYSGNGGGCICAPRQSQGCPPAPCYPFQRQQCPPTPVCHDCSATYRPCPPLPPPVSCSCPPPPPIIRCPPIQTCPPPPPQIVCPPIQTCPPPPPRVVCPPWPTCPPPPPRVVCPPWPTCPPPPPRVTCPEPIVHTCPPQPRLTCPPLSCPQQMPCRQEACAPPTPTLCPAPAPQRCLPLQPSNCGNCNSPCNNPCRSWYNSRRLKRNVGERKTITVSGPDAESPKCNSEDLRKLMTNDMTDNITESMSAIEKTADFKHGTKLNVICAEGKFSFIINSALFCQHTVGKVTCFAYST